MNAQLTLISRSYCHLCHEMETAIAPVVREYGVELKVVDVDADEGLLNRYDELVPVLLHEGLELCHYILDVAKVRDYLSKIG